MRQFFFVFACLSLMYVSSCKKQAVEPPFTEENPVFYFKGKVDNIPVSIVAGEDDYYMYSSFSQDTSGMYSFTGEFKRVSCVSNCNSIFVQINDSRRSTPMSSSKIDSLLPGKYNYLKDSSMAANFIEFSSESMQNVKPTSFKWDFGDGSASTLQNPTHSYVVPGNYNVCHTIFYSNGCANVICNEVKAESLDDCMAFIEAIPGGDSIMFNALTNGNSPSFYWNFGDTASVSNMSYIRRPSHTFSSPGIYNVHLEVITVDNCTTRVSKNIITPNYTIGCFSNFSYSKLLVPVPTHFSEITIVYKDSTGNTYKSSLATQPKDSYFEVLSVDEYQLNENNARTKKIHARFKCDVSDGKRIIAITESDAIIAVAYP